jgi:hypothetical protein
MADAWVGMPGTVCALKSDMAHHPKTVIDAGGRAPALRPDPDLELGLRLEPLVESFLSRATREPSRRLMLAVLADAIATFRRTAGMATRDDAAVFAETAHWFASDDESDPFAFVAICGALGIDAAYLRRGLKGIRARARAARPAPVLH